MINILILTTSIALAACSGHKTGKPEESTIVDSVSFQTNYTANSGTDSTTITNIGLAKIYSKAIAAYMEAIYQKDKHSTF